MGSINLEIAESLQNTGTSITTPAESAIEVPQLKQILVPVDFSAPSEAALSHALLIAERFAAKISLLFVIERKRYDESLSEWHGDLRELTRAAHRRLEMMAERTIKPSLLGTVQARPGKPFQEISAAASEMGCDLITIASHGYTGLQHVLIGSVAEGVVREAPYPILVVRRPPEEGVTPRVMTRLDKILVPVDFSSASLHALAYALWFARRFGAKVTALHVVEPPGLTAWLHIHSPAMERSLQQEAESKLNELQIDPSDGPIVTKQLGTGVPLTEILNAASSGGFDLLVISTGRQTGTASQRLGSTTERLMRHAPCPVLIVKGRENIPAPTASAPSSTASTP